MRLLLLSLFIGLTVAMKMEEPSKFPYYQDPEDAREQYEEFKRKYGKNYANDDDEKRFATFKHNLMRIEMYRNAEEGTATYEVNEFADLSAEEFAELYTNANMDIVAQPETYLEDIDMSNIPKSVDWRKKGAVLPVEQQGSCGSCWAFSAVGNIEGQWFLKTNQLVKFSKQQLLDCDKIDHGCHGGLPLNAYREIRRMGGLQTEEDYPYHGVENSCKLKLKRYTAYVNGSALLSVDETKQAAYLAENGPLSVALNANTLQFYFGGITHPWKFFCNPKGLNHAVLSVGYGIEKGKPYWIIKNSWGTRWGESGYFRMYRGDGTCGINQYVTSAIIE